ncbi:MAG: hypothetical protein U0Y68_24060 [Blastocatellia bacterium]
MYPIIRCFVALLFIGLVPAFAQAPKPIPEPANAVAILRTAKAVFVLPKSDYMNREALERELVKQPDFNQLGLLVVRDKQEAQLILEVYRKKWTTRFTITAVDARTGALVASCQESSIGGDVEPKLAKCFIKQAKAARATATETTAPKQ